MQQLLADLLGNLFFVIFGNFLSFEALLSPGMAANPVIILLQSDVDDPYVDF